MTAITPPSIAGTLHVTGAAPPPDIAVGARHAPATPVRAMGIPDLQTRTAAPAGSLPPRRPDALASAIGVRAEDLRPQVVPYRPTLDAAILGGAKAKVLVALEGEHSAARDAELGARQVLLGSLQDKLLARLPDARKAQGPLQQFAHGRLDTVFLDGAHFEEYARSMRANEAAPILFDANHGRLVVHLQQAFAPGDRLSQAGLQAMSVALGVAPGELQAPLAGKGRMLAQADSLAGPIPQYGGRQVPANEQGGAPFFKKNTHHLIDDRNPRPWLDANRNNYTHVNYFDDPGSHVGHPEISVHRGLIDNAAGIPENSLAAIRNAYRHGFRSIEIDVQIAHDRVPVLMHDFTAGRMTEDGGNRLVGDIDSGELTNSNLVIRNPVTGDFVVTDQKVPTVEQALREVHAKMPGMTVALDCKESAPEQAIALLIDNPDLRPTTAVKLYARAYPGGFDQLLGNLQQQRGIHPTDENDRGRRQELLAALKEIQLIPILSQEAIKDAPFQKFFPAPLGSKGGADEAAGLAASGMAWLKSWEATKPVILEVVQISDDAAGRAMHDIRDQLRKSDSALSRVPFSGSYRFEDFSFPQKDGTARHFTWNVFGGMVEIDASTAINVRRNTVGSFRAEADNLLTDQPDEEQWALGHDKTLAQGHSGYELDVPPGTAIDVDRDSVNTRRRTAQFIAAKAKPDPELIRLAAQGRAADQRAESASADSGPHHLGLLVPSIAGVGMAGAALNAIVRRRSGGSAAVIRTR